MDSVDVLLFEHSVIRLKSEELSDIKKAVDGFIPLNAPPDQLSRKASR
jgi:hypothetical protein